MMDAARTDAPGVQVFLADAPSSAKYMLIGKSLLMALALTAVNMAIGMPLWATATVALFVLGMTALSAVVHAKWGNRLVLETDAIIAFQHDQERYRIARSEIAQFVIHRHAVSILWGEGARKQSIILGKERFAAPTWLALTAALTQVKNGLPAAAQQ
jgi:hypothetical protein